jgi:hypothetical protein
MKKFAVIISTAIVLIAIVAVVFFKMQDTAIEIETNEQEINKPTAKKEADATKLTDIRQVRWGMSINEVKAIEKAKTATEKDMKDCMPYDARFTFEKFYYKTSLNDMPFTLQYGFNAYPKDMEKYSQKVKELMEKYKGMPVEQLKELDEVKALTQKRIEDMKLVSAIYYMPIQRYSDLEALEISIDGIVMALITKYGQPFEGQVHGNGKGDFVSYNVKWKTPTTEILLDVSYSLEYDDFMNQSVIIYQSLKFLKEKEVAKKESQLKELRDNKTLDNL